MKKKLVYYYLIISTLFFAYLSWLSVDRAINVESASVWLVPIIFLSLFFISLGLSILFIKEVRTLQLLIFISFLFSFIFIFFWSRLAIFLISVALALVAVSRIKKDLTLNIKVNILKSLSQGKIYLILALALMISSQYYSEIKDRPAEVLFPRLEIGGVTNKVISYFLTSANPRFKEMENQEVTVDQFLLEMQKDSLENNSGINNSLDIDELIGQQLGDILLPEDQEKLKQEALDKLESTQKEIAASSQTLILEEGRERLGMLVGREVKGEDKISQVFLDIINYKITQFFQPQVGQRFVMLPLILALVLLLTVVSLGNFLYIFLSRIIAGAFKLWVKMGVVRIEKVMEEVERIQ